MMEYRVAVVGQRLLKIYASVVITCNTGGRITGIIRSYSVLGEPIIPITPETGLERKGQIAPRHNSG
jgi:hypothetical protein